MHRLEERGGVLLGDHVSRLAQSHQSVVFPSRQHVKMHVKHHLSRGGAVVLHDVDPVATGRILDDLGEPGQLLEDLPRHIGGHVYDGRVAACVVRYRCRIQHIQDTWKRREEGKREVKGSASASGVREGES